MRAPGLKPASGWKTLSRLALPACCRLAEWTVPWLPRRGVTALSRLAGTLGERCCPRDLRRMAWANLDVAFGRDLDERSRRRILRESFANLALMALDLIWFSRDGARRVRRFVDVDENARSLVKQLPLVGVTAHYGNWELLVRAWAAHGVSLVCPAARISDEALQAQLERWRGASGAQFVRREGAVKSLRAALQAGKSLGIVMDQNVQPSRGGEFVNFFGVPAAASVTAAALARRTGRPLVPLYCVPTPGGRYRVFAGTPLDAVGPPGANAREHDVRVTQEIMRRFEDQIRLRPGLWQWTYHCWRYIPFGTKGRRRHPYYADITIVPRAILRNMKLDAKLTGPPQAA